MKTPLVSVVIPTLNEEKYLPACLESFKRQTFKDFEIIVADGSSTDKTEEIASRYGAKFIVIPDSTVTVARQKGAETAKGQIIVGADADTVYPADHLEMIYDDFRQNPKLVAVGGGGVFEKKPWWAYWGWKTAYFLFGLLYRYTGIVFYTPAFNLSFKKSVFDNIGGYDTNLDYGGDEIDMLAKLKRAGKVIFDSRLSPNPSSRRAKIGFWKMMIKHTFIDYYLSFFLAKLFHRTVIRGRPVR